MADGVCVDGTGINKNNGLVKETVELLSISHKNCLDDTILDDMNASFFISGKRADLCRCFGSTGVVSLDVHASEVLCGDKTSEHVEFAQICQESEDNCRKKRCTDRYDSSESSDSGVAALSSSGTSDITDPGSPFSTASTSSNSESGDEKCYPSTPPTPQWSPHKSSSDSGHGEQTDKEHTSEGDADFASESRSVATGSPQDRNFHSLGNAENLPKVSRSLVPFIQTRNPWSFSLKTGNSDATLCSKTFTSTQIPLEGDDEVSTPEAPSSPCSEKPKPSKTGRPATSKCSRNSSDNQEHETSLATVETSCLWNLSEASSVTATGRVPRRVSKYCIFPRKTASKWVGTKSILKTVKDGEDSVKSSFKGGHWKRTLHSIPNYRYRTINGLTRHRTRILVPAATSSARVLSPSRPKNCVLTDTSSENLAQLKSNMAPNVSADAICENSDVDEKDTTCMPRTSLVMGVCVTRQQTQKGGVIAASDQNHNMRKCVGAQETGHDEDVQQEKITKYFKTQVKPVSAVKRELAKDFQCPNISKNMCLTDNQNGDTGSIDEYYSLISTPPPNKIAKKDHVVGNKSMSLNRATSQVQIILVNKLETDPRMPKTLRDSKSRIITSPRKIETQSLSKASDKETHLPILSSKKTVFLKPANHRIYKKTTVTKLKLQPVKKIAVAVNHSEGVPVVTLTSSELGSVTSSSCKTLLASSDALTKNSKSNFKFKTVSDEELSINDCSSDSPSALFSSLSVSIANAATSCQLSPILSAPKTIRFPAAQRKSLHTKDQDRDEKCCWADCKAVFETNAGLIDHLQTEHVANQVRSEHYVCLWMSCKVYARTSCSRSWLERHVLSHGGNKPFRCIVEGCGQRFGTNTALERHVNGHFDQDAGGQNNAGQRRSIDGAPGKLMRRNGKKLRYRKQPWSARMFDYFDASIMERLQFKLMRLTNSSSTVVGQEDCVKFTSTVVGKRISESGDVQSLLRWSPKGMLEDEWVPELKGEESRTVPICKLSHEAKCELYPLLFRTSGKHQRKPPKKT